MRTESTSERLSNAIFLPLKNWVETSNDNWNILLLIGLVLLFLSIVSIFIFSKKIGKADERTNQIHLKSTLIMLYVIIFLDLVFPKEFMWQIFFIFKYSLAFCSSGFYLAFRYKKDFLN